MSNLRSIRSVLTKNIVDIAQSIGPITHVGTVMTDDISAAWVEVEKGSLIRVQITADTYFSFSENDKGAVTVTAATTPGLKLSAGYHYIVASCDFIRASANPSRIELLQV